MGVRPKVGEGRLCRVLARLAGALARLLEIAGPAEWPFPNELPGTHLSAKRVNQACSEPVLPPAAIRIGVQKKRTRDHKFGYKMQLDRGKCP